MAVDKGELQGAVREARAAGRLTNGLGLLAGRVCEGYLSSRQYQGLSLADKQDILSKFHLRLLRNWGQIDPDKNAFSYLTNMARSVVSTHCRSLMREYEHNRLRTAQADPMEGYSAPEVETEADVALEEFLAAVEQYDGHLRKALRADSLTAAKKAELLEPEVLKYARVLLSALNEGECQIRVERRG
ncbi:MAG: hypothetical protein Q7Q73_02550 [Verrucomicrobiota bacterium JB024]|nr:hypothetical protein [Verrucomicrobiota bacterium JB024]